MVGDAAQVRAEIVGYRGSAPLTTDLVGGQVPVAFDTLDSLLPQHDAGKVRILAVSSAKRSPLAPNVPTFRRPVWTWWPPAGTRSLPRPACLPRRWSACRSSSMK